MYDLPEKPTMADVIRRSIVCHPGLFAEVLQKVAKTHGDYALTTHNKLAAQSASSMEAATLFAIECIERADGADLCRNFSARIIAFGAASKLQCLPQHMQTEIAERESKESAQ